MVQKKTLAGAKVGFTANSEAPGGFEPPHKGFADLSLTTWVRRRCVSCMPRRLPAIEKPRRLVGLGQRGYLNEEDKARDPLLRRPPVARGMLRQSGRRDLNPRHQPWQGCALPTELLPQNTMKYNYCRDSSQAMARARERRRRSWRSTYDLRKMPDGGIRNISFNSASSCFACRSPRVTNTSNSMKSPIPATRSR